MSPSALELKVPPLALAALLATAMWLGARLAPSLSFAMPGRIGVVAVLAAAGFVVVLAGALAFRSARTTVDPRQPTRSAALVSNGIYRFSRNPMYVGFTLLLAAWALHLANLLAPIALPAFVAYVTRFQIVPEERALRAKFGRAFDDYARSVRRWL
jgi:protein-S-isoprenylcysteine O-methyltransferase Ste14